MAAEGCEDGAIAGGPPLRGRGSGGARAAADEAGDVAGDVAGGVAGDRDERALEFWVLVLEARLGSARGERDAGAAVAGKGGKGLRKDSGPGRNAGASGKKGPKQGAGQGHRTGGVQRDQRKWQGQGTRLGRVRKDQSEGQGQSAMQGRVPRG